MFRDISVKKKLFGLIPVILIIVTVVIGISYKSSVDSIRHIAEENLEAMVKQFIFFTQYDQHIDFEFLKPLCNEKIKIGKKGFIFIVEKNGNLYVHKHAQGKNWADKPHIKKILERKNGTLRYVSPETKTVKIAAFHYSEKLDKIVVASVFEEDLIGETQAKLLRTAIVQFVVVGLIIFLIIFFLSRSIVMPINKLISTLHEIIGDDVNTLDLRHRVHLKITNEIGVVGNALDALMNKIQTLVQENNDNSEKLNYSSQQQTSTVQEISVSIEKMNAQSNTITSSVEESSVNMTSIASSSEEMSLSVSAVAAAIEEMSTTTNDIARNCQKESEIAEIANSQAQSTNEMMNKLEVSANEIGKVLDVIKAIADQTNLLALNATIEAASAGEAGRGFGVVANEVKELAKQTAQAIEEIDEKISDIRSNTTSSVKSIKEITTVIEDVNNISQTIVAAVEEQSSTINEISKSVSHVSTASNEVSQNVQKSAIGLDEISSNISGLSQAIDTITNGMGEVESSTHELSSMAEKLREAGDCFQV